MPRKGQERMRRTPDALEDRGEMIRWALTVCENSGVAPDLVAKIRTGVLSSSTFLNASNSLGKGIFIYSDGDVLFVLGRPPGWSVPIVARLVVWVFTLGFAVFASRQAGFTFPALLAAAIFGCWSVWSFVRVVGIARERVIAILSRDAFAIRRVRPLTRDGLGGANPELEIDEPRMTRDPEGGIELFPMHFLRCRTQQARLNVLTGHQRVELVAAYSAIVAWRNQRSTR